MTQRPFLPWLMLLLACSGTPPASPDPAPRAQPRRNVLFIGNSYTYVNDLPGMFTRLAAAGGFDAEAAMVAAGGWTLADHAASGQTLEAIQRTKWDYVVLQEQSEVPAIERERVESMYPAVRRLVRAIAAVGGKPVLFMTWGHREGLHEEGFKDFEAMQSELSEGYARIARELGVEVAAVGNAWRNARARTPEISLWQPDGSHPTVHGSYLAACVLYSTVFKRSPVGLSYSAGLPMERARVLQSIAAAVVSRERTS